MIRKGILLALAAFLLIPPALTAAPQKKAEPKKQDNKKSREAEVGNRALRKWLDEDVAYIITDEEKAAFKALQTDEEREQFIENFWLRRDPSPETIENEFKEDHYGRIAYANDRFASGKPGWKTDRGRIYILYGKPAEIESHAGGGMYERPIEEGGGTTSTFPFEIWRYRYVEGLGNDILLEFVDPTMTGEYRLTIDPSEKDALLMVPGAGLTLDEMFNGTDKAARFNITDNETKQNGMFGKGIRYNQFERLNLYANVFRPPEVKFKDLQTIVTTKLSYNLLPFNFRTDFVRVTEESVLTPVTILLQNKDLAFQEQEGIHRAVVHVFGQVTGINGRVAQTFEDTISQDIPDALFKQALEGGSSVHQRIVPLRPGLYKLDLVLKDINSGNVGTVNQRLLVPRFPDDKLQLSSLILADLVENLPPNQIGSGPFILGGDKVRPNVKEQFERNRNLNLWFQVYNLKLDEATHKPSATIETLITRNGQEVRKTVEQATELSNAAAQMTLAKTLALSDFEPGEYGIQVKVTDNLTKDVIAATEKFAVR
jgi:GWxTD domain-containing protein